MGQMSLLRSVVIAVAISISSQLSAQDSPVSALNVSEAADLAKFIELIEATDSVGKQLREVEEALKGTAADIVAKLQTTPPLREAVITYIEKMAVPIVKTAQSSPALRSAIALQQDLMMLEATLSQLQTKLVAAQQVAQADVQQLIATKDAAQKFLHANHDVLAFARTSLLASLKTPQTITISGKPVTFEVVEAGSSLGNLSLSVSYGATGLAAKVTGVRVTNSPPFLDLSKAKVSPPDGAGVVGIATRFLGDALKDLPLPLTVEKLDVKRADASAGLPNVTITVVAKIPGIEFLTDTLAAADPKNGRIVGTIEVQPDGTVVPDSISFQASLVSSPIFPLGTTGLETQLTALGASKDAVKIIGRIGATGTLVGDPQFILAFQLTPSIRSPFRVEFKGQIIVGGTVIGDFKSEFSERGVTGDVTIPAKDSPPYLGLLYKGDFHFTLDKESLSANGIAELVKVLHSNFELYLRLKGDGPSFFKGTQSLSLDGLSGEATIFGELSTGFKEFHGNATAWVAVDLGIYKPTARIEISAHCSNTAQIPLNPIGPLGAFTFDITASALGVQVSWSPPSLEDISLSDIERRLRKHLEASLNRISSAAAKWEKEKRELFAKWEKHWSDTLHSEAEKYGLDKVKTGNDEVDKFLGSISTGGKEVGGWLHRASQGVGGTLSDVRGQVSDGLADGEEEVRSWFGAGIIRQSPFRQVSFVAFSGDDIADRARFRKVLIELHERARVNKLDNVADYIKPFRESLKDDAARRSASKVTEKLFGGGEYSKNIGKAIRGEPVTPNTAADIAYARQALDSWPLFISDLQPPNPNLPPDDPNTVRLRPFEEYSQKLRAFESLKTRVETSVDGTETTRQLHMTFGDTSVQLDDSKVVTIATIARVTGVTIARSASGSLARKAATNLVPVTITFRPLAFSDSAYAAEFDVPDVAKVNERQLEWMKQATAENKVHEKVTDAEKAALLPDPNTATSPEERKRIEEQRARIDQGLTSEAARFDFTDDLATAESQLLQVFGISETDGRGFDATAIVRHALQSVIERSLPEVRIGGPKAFTESDIAIKNETESDVVVRIKARQRQVVDGDFRWDWIPTRPGDAAFLEYRIPARTVAALPLKQDNSAAFDDFGGNAPSLHSSRIRVIAENAEGEIWDYSNTDIFTVPTNGRLGEDRSYEAAARAQYIFTIQSRRVPLARQVTLFQGTQAHIEHRGPVGKEFTLPVGTGNVDLILKTLTVRLLVPSQGAADEWDWDATIPSDVLRGGVASNESQTPTSRREIRIRLAPRIESPTLQPGAAFPTQNVAISYSQEATAWRAFYQLRLSPRAGTHARQFDSELRGFYLFENSSGADWRVTDINLKTGTALDQAGFTEHDTRGLSAVSLPRNHARLALQSGRRLEVQAIPYLVFDPTVQVSHPLRQVQIQVAGSATEGLVNGTMMIIEGEQPTGEVAMPQMKKGDATVIKYPNVIEERMCINENRHSPEVTNEVLCLKEKCLHYVPLKRVRNFEVNYSEEYAASSVTVKFVLPKEDGWQQAKCEVRVGQQEPKQPVTVEQFRDGTWKPEQLDLCLTPIEKLRAFSLAKDDPFRWLLDRVAALREQGRIQEVNALLCTPDLRIERIDVACGPVSQGMKLCLSVSVVNAGGGPAVFGAGTPILSADGFVSVKAGGDGERVDACCRRTWKLESLRIAIAPSVNVRFQVDPDNRVGEWDEKNNERLESVTIIK